MDRDFEQILDAGKQSALAEEVVTTLAAVASDMTAPASALRALEKGRNETLAPEERAAAAALQAYGARCAAAVFTAGLDQQAAERAAELGQALEDDSDAAGRDVLAGEADAGAAFKSTMCHAIAAKCAELVAADVDRAKNGPFNILNEDDARLFEARQAEHREQRMRAATEFLSSLPARFPSFGPALFASIRQDVQEEIAEKHKRPDTHAAVAGMFDEALASMPPQAREEIERLGKRKTGG